MISRRSSGSSQPHSSGRGAQPKGLKADVEGSTPMKVLRALAEDAEVAGQIGMMSREALAQAITAIDDFNASARLPALHPHLTMRMQREIDRQRALRARPAHPR